MTSLEPSSSKLLRYDVFLSFRGEDTRNGFTSHLHAALQGRGLAAFIDEDNLKRGGEIKPELLRAIEESRISVIVFSKSYAESSWCLDELVKIMECRERLGQEVLPIFYHVDPSHVRKQEGCLARAFQKHEDGILDEKDDNECEAKKERVKQWREALTQAANLSGHHLNNRNEAKVIKTIVEDNIQGLLPGTDEVDVDKYLVGIDSRVQPIINDLFNGGLDDVKMVGIWGMGGMGKTTAANAIYNKIHFQFKCYLHDVSNTDLVCLQNQLVSNILKRTFQINSVNEGIGVIKRHLRRTKVLIVIDNADKLEQLNAIAGDREWFGPGSIIIITTRDEHLLNQVRVNMRYPAKEMNEEEALELFSWRTFDNSCPEEKYLELSKKVVSYCGGLPLALKVLGSFLVGRTIAVWQSYLEKLKRIPEGEIIKKLKISFDELDDNQKTIFLYIFCCFLGLEKNYVTKILDECRFYATCDINVLCERCLIIVEWGKLKMHDLIQEMAKTIISEKSPTQPGGWSRLLNHEAIKVVANKSGIEEIEALSLDLPSSEKNASFSTEAFYSMKKLRFLRLSNVELPGSFEQFSKELRWLYWHGFPFEYMPEHLLNQPELVALDLRFSRLRKGWKNSKPLENLKILDLSKSYNLKKSPDFSRLPNLGELNFESCYGLSEIHSSIGQLKKLTRVDLQFCRNLKYLPAEFYKLKSVETIYLNCGLRELPEGLGEMVSLRELDASVEQLPNALGRLISLQELTVGFAGCRSLPSLSGLSNLVELTVTFCHELRAIPDLPTNLEYLRALACGALETMPDFSQMSNMRRLSLRGSPKVREVPGLGLGTSLNSMAELDMRQCTNLTAEFRNDILQGWTSCGVGGILLDRIYGIPEWFDFVANGNKVSFDVPQCEGRNFKGLTLCWVTRQCQSESVAFTVVNCTKHTTSRVSGPFWGALEEDHFGQVQLSNDKLKLNLQGGDKIVIRLEGFRVMKTGVNLVWDKPLKENKPVGLGDYYYEYESEAVPDWLNDESSPGPSHDASDGVDDHYESESEADPGWLYSPGPSHDASDGVDDYYESESEADPGWLYDESSPGPSHDASDNHPTNQMTTSTDEPKRKRQKV